MQDALEFRNHKGACGKPELLKKLVYKDVTHGYGHGLVIPLAKVLCVPGLIITPMNIMNKNTINKSGRIIGKDCLIHDQSCKWISDTLANSQGLKVPS